MIAPHPPTLAPDARPGRSAWRQRGHPRRRDPHARESRPNPIADISREHAEPLPAAVLAMPVWSTGRVPTTAQTVARRSSIGYR
jgi:hypothetical protein